MNTYRLKINTRTLKKQKALKYAKDWKMSKPFFQPERCMLVIKMVHRASFLVLFRDPEFKLTIL